jgi:hypothetical protein
MNPTMKDLGIDRLSPEQQLALALEIWDNLRTQPQSAPLPPELRDWAANQFSEEQIVEGVREIQRTGGVELKDFIHELNAAARAHE